MSSNILTVAGGFGHRAIQAESVVREHLASIPTPGRRDAQVDHLIDVLECVSRSANPAHAEFIIASHGEHGGLAGQVAKLCAGDPTMVLPAALGAINAQTEHPRFEQIQNAWAGARSALAAHGLSVDHSG